jgi:hypothetical protein
MVNEAALSFTIDLLTGLCAEATKTCMISDISS